MISCDLFIKLLTCLLAILTAEVWLDFSSEACKNLLCFFNLLLDA